VLNFEITDSGNLGQVLSSSIKLKHKFPEIIGFLIWATARVASANTDLLRK